MAITINHSINLKGMGNFESTFNSLFSKIENMMSKMSNKMEQASTKFDKTSSKFDKIASNYRQSKIMADTSRDISSSRKEVDKNINNKFSTLAQDVSNSFKTLNKDVSNSFKQIAQDSKNSFKKINDEVKQQSQSKPPVTYDKEALITKTLIGGLGLSLKGVIGKISERGSIEGATTNALNTSVTNSVDFAQSYQTQMLLNQQQTKSGLVSGIANTASVAGMLAGGAMGFGIAGLSQIGAGAYNYFTGKQTQEDIATNQFKLQQDMNAWRMSNVFGLGSTTSGNVNIGNKTYGTQISRLQADMLSNPSLSPYAFNTPDYVFGANRQQFNMGGNIGANVKNTTALGMATGVNQQNMSQFIGNVTTLAGSMGQKDSTNILQKLLDSYNKYGGDIAKNTAQALQLMQTTHMSFPQALDIANRYQYNPSALQNVTNFQNATPMNKWLGATLGRMFGWSENEVKSGHPNASHMREYRQAQRGATNKGELPPFASMMTDMVAGYFGQNLNVENTGVFKKNNAQSQMNIESLANTPPTSQTALSDMLQNALSNTTIGVKQIVADKLEILSHSFANPEMFRSSVEAQAKKEYNQHSGTGITK